jgi:hypothetical protein
MTSKRRLIHAFFLLLLPIVVAWFGLGVPAAITAVLLALIWRWAIVLSGIVAPEKTPDMILETISASHYVEKVRWCMDRLGVEYTERQNAGVIGVFFTGRSVPQLKVRTGLVQSVIGNSSDILRYLWGTCFALLPEAASFLQPTTERLELEARIDRYGRDLQVWVYYHILDERDLALHAWGANSPLVPYWQRLIVTALFPLLAFLIRKSFSISDGHYAKVVQNIERLLSDIDARLDGGNASILGGDTSNYTDITFAAMSGLWLQPEKYGGGKADACRIERDHAPARMREDIERWIKDHPASISLIERLYEQER